MSAPLPRPTTDELRRLYAEAGSRDELGRRLGITGQAAANWLRDAGIPRNPTGVSLRSPWRNGLGKKKK